jgi:hypothetical protein
MSQMQLLQHCILKACKHVAATRAHQSLLRSLIIVYSAHALQVVNATIALTGVR